MKHFFLKGLLFSIAVGGICWISLTNWHSIPMMKLSDGKSIISVNPEIIIAAENLKELWITKLEAKEQPYKTNITRSEAARMLVRLTKVKELKELFDIKIDTNKDCHFKEFELMKLKDDSLFNEITESCQANIFNGYNNGKFGLWDFLTREQAVLVLARLLSDNKNMWTDEAYELLLNWNIIKRDDRKTWNTQDTIIREHFFLLIHRTVKALKVENATVKLENYKEQINKLSEEEVQEMSKDLLEKVMKNIEDL